MRIGRKRQVRGPGAIYPYLTRRSRRYDRDGKLLSVAGIRILYLSPTPLVRLSIHGDSLK